MRVRVRNHVNPLMASFADLRSERPLLIPGQPVEVEIGCADALFLFERAAVDAQRCYVGLEIREELVDAVNREAAATGAPVQAIFCHANRHMAKLFDAGRADRVYVNFPDPWFKKRHHKRRMVDAGLARDCATLLRPGGELMVQTDVWEVALDALGAFEDVLVNRAGPWTFWKNGNPYGAKSWREKHCEKRELQIWRLLYRKRP